MIKRLIAFLLIVFLIGPPSVMASGFVAYTTNGTGTLLWNVPTNFTPNGTPGCGDTLTGANGVILQVPAGYVACIGDSVGNPTNSGTAAIQCATTAGTFQLQIFGSMRQEGRFDQCNAPWLISTANWTTAGDGSLIYDATGASSPSAALYTWNIGVQASSTSAVLNIVGNATHPVVISSQGNINSGGFGNQTSNFSDSGNFNGTYFNASYVGAASSTGNFLWMRPTTTAGVVMSHFNIDHSGNIAETSAMCGACSVNLTFGKISTPVNTSSNGILQIEATTAKTTGTRLFQHMIFSGGRIFVDGTPGQNDGFVTDDVEYDAPVATSGVPGLGPFNFTNGSPTTWSNVLAIGALNFANFPGGSLSNTYGMSIYNPANCFNNHPFNIKVGGQNATLNGFVFEGCSDTGSDQVEPTADATVSGVTVALINPYFLANAFGDNTGSELNASFLGATWNNLKLSVTHALAVIGSVNVGPTSLVQGAGCEAGPGKTAPVGTYTVANNSYFRPASGGGIAIQSQTSTCGASAGAAALADYNNTFNITGSIYGNPAGQFATTPGVNDLAVNPFFVDPTRNFAKYDTDPNGLNNAVAPAWVTGTAYAAGDIRSNSVTGWYGSATYNYVAVDAHTSGSTTQPGTGSAWATHWVFATQRDVEAGILAGTTPNVSSLLAYVKGGFKFTNILLHNTGSDGLDRGPVGSYLAPPSTGNAAISGRVTTTGNVVVQ